MKEGSKKLRIVCDTNVLLSMLGFPEKRLERFWMLIREEEVALFTSEFILEELSRNLRVKVRFEVEEVEEIIRLLRDRAQVVYPEEKLDVIQEKAADNRILECAVEARADVLVTGNFKHIRPLGFFKGIEILTPREFMDKYFPSP